MHIASWLNSIPYYVRPRKNRKQNKKLNFLNFSVLKIWNYNKIQKLAMAKQTTTNLKQGDKFKYKNDLGISTNSYLVLYRGIHSKIYTSYFCQILICTRHLVFENELLSNEGKIFLFVSAWSKSVQCCCSLTPRRGWWWACRRRQAGRSGANPSFSTGAVK